jgi:hypothetical protein
MIYYKIIVDNQIIGVSSQSSLQKYNVMYDIMLYSSVSDAQYLALDDNKLYHDDRWMCRARTNKISSQEAQIIPIEKEEYEFLYATFKNNEEIFIEQEEDISFIDKEEKEELIDPIEEITVDFIKTSKFAEMSYNCNKTITNGFDIILSDGNSYHFSLTTQDQLNLITLATMVESGETQIPYHADGEPCKFYSTLDMKAIIDKATEFKTYHISYYNSLKTYINSMETMEEISEVTYGIEIPQEYQSEVLKTLNK